MNVLINAASANMGGAVTYLKNVLKWLPILAPQDKFIVYLPEATKAKFAALHKDNQVELVTYPYADTGGKERMYFDQVTISKLAKKYKADVVFSSTGFGTYFCPCPQVLLVRNPVYFSKDFHSRYKELGRSLRRNTQRRVMSLLSIKSSDFVLFPTTAMQHMVEAYIDLSKKASRAMHYGFDHAAFSQNGAGKPDFEDQLRQWKEEGYFLLLNVSTYAVHKNFELLIEALPHLRTKGKKIKLLTTTSREKTADKTEYDVLKQRAKELGVDDMWHEMQYVPYEHLKSLYEAADVYVFPSFTESFGHSLVEAMASGLPIVAADMTINREVCADAAVYFPRFDVEACAQAISKIITESGEKDKLEKASHERATLFSWEKYSQNLVNLFHELAA